MKKRIALALAITMLFSVVFASCSSGEKPADQSSKPADATKQIEQLVVNVGSEPDTIDPALNSAADGATLLIHSFEGLMVLDSKGVPAPGQAKEYKVSDDGLTYTFTLRDGLKWSDGQPLTSKDFAYSWNRAVNPVTAADYANMFQVIEGYDAKNAEGKAEPKLNVQTPDDKTIIVKLVAPCPYFLELAAFPTYMPVRKDIIEANPEKWATEAATYISNGPYKMKEWTHKSNIVYEQNPNYWNNAKIGPKAIKFLLMDDDNAILAAYKNNEIMFADSMPNEEIDAWREKDDFFLEGQIGTYYISYNVKKAPLDNPKVRQALTLAVDRENIVKNIGKSGQIPAGAFVSMGLTDADPTKQFREVGGDYFDPKATESNLEKAKKLLEEAGFKDGVGLPSIEYLYNEGTGHKAIGEALQADWAKIGVKVTLKSQEWNTFLNSRKKGDYQIARNGWLGDYNDPISFLDMWVTGGGNNDAQWSNKEYDELIKQITVEKDKAKRFKLMHDAEEIIFDEWMLCPIYYYVDLYLKNPKLEGFYASPLGYKYFMYTSEKA